MRLRLLRLLLLTTGFGWVISIYGVFASWPAAVGQLRGLGAGDIPHDPMLDYWLRMTAGAFTAIGLLFLAMALNPKRFAVVIAPAACFLVAEGIILLVYGLRLGLDPIPFYVDATFCLMTGVGIWLLRGEVRDKS
jgi:hypothetical protein